MGTQCVEPYQVTPALSNSWFKKIQGKNMSSKIEQMLTNINLTVLKFMKTARHARQ